VRDGVKPGMLSDVACFSFYPAKVLGCYGEGGMAICDNDYLAEVLYLLRDHGEAPGYPPLDERDHKIEMWGYNTILDNIQAAVLNVKLNHLDDWTDKRREISTKYDLAFYELPNIKMPDDEMVGDKHSVWQNFVIRTPKRNELRDYLTKNGIETLISWPIPLHKHEALRTELGKYYLPVTEEISRTCLSLPLYPELTDREVDYVIQSVREFFE
jgi:dTDP-4-amino-4,6-dideoxygalactose transaminase